MKKPTKEEAKSQKMRRVIEVSQGGVVNPWKVGWAHPKSEHIRRNEAKR